MRRFGAVLFVAAAFVAGSFATAGGSSQVSSMLVDRPVRVYDSRAGHSGPLVAGELINPQVDWSGAAQVVAVNVTVVNPSAAGYVTVWAEGPTPSTSNLNFQAGQTVANLVITEVGQSGSISVRVSAGCHLLIDVQAVWS